MNNLWKQRDGLNHLFKLPKYNRLKYAALISIGISILLEIVSIIWMDDISYKTLLFIRGCIGLGAIIFVILVAILCYRVNTDYFRNR